MKQSILFCSVILLSAAIQAQPVGKKAMNYNIGDTITYQVCDTTGVTSGTSGVNQFWDFSALAAQTQLGLKIKNPSEVPLAASFPNANLVEQYSDGTLQFIANSQNKYMAVGASNGSSSTLSYPKSQQLMFRPLVYGQSQHDSFSTDGTGSGTDYWGTGNTHIICDAWGTLKLPNRTYPGVVRVKVSSLEYDTIDLPTPVTSISTAVSYFWFDSVHATPLLKMDSFYIVAAGQTYIFKTVNYFQDPSPAGIAELRNVLQHNLNCQLSATSLVVLSPLSIGARYEISVFDLNGRKLHNSTFNAAAAQNRIALKQQLPPGDYLVLLIGNNMQVSTKVSLLQ